MSKNLIIEVIGAIFILIFAYTGVSKLIDLANFQSVLSKSPIIGDYNILVSWTIPLVEFAVCLLLLVPRFRKIGLYASLILMASFTIYIAYMLIYIPNLPCTCGGIISKMTWTQHLIFNISLVLISILGIWLSTKRARELTSHNQTNFSVQL